MSEYSCQVRRHGKHHIELKTKLPIPETGHGRFDLNFYFFSPSQLRFNKETLSIKKVLSNIQTYTRFTSPTLPLSALSSLDCELSPLCRINQYLEKLELAVSVENHELIYELQTLVNSFRGEMKSFIFLLEQQLNERVEDIELYEERIRTNLKDIKKILKVLRSFFPRFLDGRIDEKARIGLSWTDEALGLLAVRNAIRLHSILESYGRLDGVKSELQNFVLKENQYRAERQYITALQSEKNKLKEKLAYRDSILKKWTQSAMYLRSVESKIPRNIGHILSGLAAATAMTFAVLAAVYAERFFIKNTTPWALIIILSYVFKDRIKEILRDVFAKLLPKFAADKIFRLIEPSTLKQAGLSQVIVRFGYEKDIPEEIREMRNSRGNPFSSILPPLDVLQYHRYISLNSKMIRSTHTRHNGITEITRIRIDDYLKEMDDPEDVSYKLEKGKRKKILGNRVYHIHLIVALKEDSKRARARFFHYCLIMNRSGLLRVEFRGAGGRMN